MVLNSGGGASLDYGTDWQGEFQLNDVTLLSYQLNPSIGYQLNEQLSVAFGAQVSVAYLEQNTSLMQLEGSYDVGYGYNLDAVYQPTERMRLGLSYRSKIEHEFDGDFAILGISAGYETMLPFPAVVDASAAYQWNDQLSLLATLQWQQWSAMKSTVINISTQDFAMPYMIERNWDNVWHFALGIDYQLSSQWSLKAGYSYETSPLSMHHTKPPDLPIGEQNRYSLGFETPLDNGSLTFYYEFADFGDMPVMQTSNTEISLQGDLTGQVHFIGTSYTF